MSASFDSYKVFYYVGKFGNISRAASSLFLSQSTVSRTIQSLETELGCKLFERSQHGVVMTHEGESLYQFVSRAYEQIIEGEKSLREMLSLQTECLHIGVTEFTFSQYILPALPAFCRDYPDVRLEFCTQKLLHDNATYSRLNEGTLDFLCTVTPLPEFGNCTAIRFAEFSDVLVAGAQFQELRGKEIESSALQNYPIVSYTSFGEADDFLDQTVDFRATSLFPKFRVDSGTHFMQLTRLGLCLSMIPEPVFRSLPADVPVFQVRLKEPLPVREACIITSREHTLSGAGNFLINTIMSKAMGQTFS